jgi:hypothetical protein
MAAWRMHCPPKLQLKLHAGPVTRLVMAYDDTMLLSAGADGAVALLDVRDKELAKSSTRRDMVGPGSGEGGGGLTGPVKGEGC